MPFSCPRSISFGRLHDNAMHCGSREDSRAAAFSSLQQEREKRRSGFGGSPCVSACGPESGVYSSGKDPKPGIWYEESRKSIPEFSSNAS